MVGPRKAHRHQHLTGIKMYEKKKEKRWQLFKEQFRVLVNRTKEGQPGNGSVRSTKKKGKPGKRGKLTRYFCFKVRAEPFTTRITHHKAEQEQKYLHWGQEKVISTINQKKKGDH